MEEIYICTKKKKKEKKKQSTFYTQAHIYVGYDSDLYFSRESKRWN